MSAETPSSAPENEVTVGQQNWSKLLSELQAEVTQWNEVKSGVSWDKAVWPTDKLRKKGDTLVLIRGSTTNDIAVLKSTLPSVKPPETVPAQKKDIRVQKGDSISGILNSEFGRLNYQYGDKDGVKNLPTGWDKIFIGEKLQIATDGRKLDSGKYLYTLSRSKNGKQETITPVSSTCLLKKWESSSANPEKKEDTPRFTVANIKNVFPRQGDNVYRDILAGKNVVLNGASYQLARLDNGKAIVGQSSVDFEKGVTPQTTDMIFIVTNSDKTKTAHAYQKLGNGMYSPAPR